MKTKSPGMKIQDERGNPKMTKQTNLAPSPLIRESQSLLAQLKFMGYSHADVIYADGKPVACQKDFTLALMNLMRPKVVELRLRNGEALPIYPVEMWIEMCQTIKPAPFEKED